MTTDASSDRQFESFKDFYPYYLQEHSNRICRRLHFIGSTGVILLVLAALITLNPWFLLFVPLMGYGFAWVGHFFFEHNRPATFKHPLYSLWGDWVMYGDMMSGRIRF